MNFIEYHVSMILSQRCGTLCYTVSHRHDSITYHFCVIVSSRCDLTLTDTLPYLYFCPYLYFPVFPILIYHPHIHDIPVHFPDPWNSLVKNLYIFQTTIFLIFTICPISSILSSSLFLHSNKFNVLGSH